MAQEQAQAEQSALAASDEVFLHPRTKVEPLICGWYAWSHLIAPAQQAMNLAFRYVPLLQSFIANPAVHIAATRDPKMFGGPFMALGRDKVPAVRRLLAQTNERCAGLLTLAQELKALSNRLQSTATGSTLNAMYNEIPPSLRGLVEFVYDIDHHARLRLLEELFYDLDLGAQAEEILISRMAEDERPFFMSTPRVEEPDSLSLRMRFSDKRLDALASLRVTPRPLEDAVAQMGLQPEEAARFQTFLTREAPIRRSPEYIGDGVRLRYFGHACVLLQTSRTSILIDPVVAVEPGNGDGRFAMSDLPDFIDYVVLTHNHQDHCSPEMLVQLRHKVGRIVVPRNNSGSLVDPSMKVGLQHLGYTRIDVLDSFDTVKFEDGEIISLPFPGEHVDLEIYSRQALCVQVKGRRFGFLVDSDGRDPALYKRIASRIGGRLDAVFLGMECYGAPLTWLYGPLLTRPISRQDDEARRLTSADCERAWSVLQNIDCARVFIYGMGQEPWLKYIMGLEYAPDSIQLKEMNAFLDRCAQAGIPAERLNISREMMF